MVITILHAMKIVRERVGVIFVVANCATAKMAKKLRNSSALETKLFKKKVNRLGVAEELCFCYSSSVVLSKSAPDEHENWLDRVHVQETTYINVVESGLGSLECLHLDGDVSDLQNLAIMRCILSDKKTAVASGQTYQLVDAFRAAVSFEDIEQILLRQPFDLDGKGEFGYSKCGSLAYIKKVLSV